MKATLRICLLLICLIVTGCSKDDAESISIKDPEGTISLDITDSSIENQIYISNGNLQGALFVQMGEINGLGNITSIPKAGWAAQVIAMERHGYIAWANGIYYRLYLSTYNAEKALVKYQRPFLGTETEIIPTKTTVLFEKEASYQEIAFLNKTLFPYTVKSSEDWCRVYSVQSTKNTPYDKVKIMVIANDKSEIRNSAITISSDISEDITIMVSQQEADGWLSIEKSELNVEAIVSSAQIQISSNANWSVQSNSPWCKVEQSDNILAINVDENGTGKLRTAIITIMTEDTKDKKQIIVNQNIPTLGVSKNSLEFEGVATSDFFAVFSNVSFWTVESNQTWCKVQRYENKVTVSVNENNTGEDRSAVVSVIMPGQTEKVNVTQKTPTLGISKESFIFEGCASEDSFIVSSNTTSWSVSSNQPWCTIEQSGENVRIFVSENLTGKNRNAIVSVKMPDGRKREVYINQKVPIFSISHDSIDFEGCTSRREIVVTTNISGLKAQSNDEWCLTSVDNNTVQIMVFENMAGQARNTSVIISLPDGQTQTIKITQSMPTLNVLTNNINIPKAQTSESVIIESNVSSWIATCDALWCKVSKDDSNINLVFDENLSGNIREAKIIVSLPNDQKLITIKQGAWVIGDYYNVENIQGLVCEIDNFGLSGTLISLDEVCEIWSTKTEHVSPSEDDGIANTEAIKQKKNWEQVYPAAYWCVNKGAGWYMPARNELKQFLSKFVESNNDPDLNRILTTLSTYGEPIKYSENEIYYWSSTSIRLGDAAILIIHQDRLHAGFVTDMGRKNYVRAFKKF